MEMLGLNPDEQDVVDIPNEVARKGLIYFPDFCQIILERMRSSEEEEEDFKHTVFKHMCGTEPHPTDFRAKKYKLEKNFLEKVSAADIKKIKVLLQKDFIQIMRSLPVEVEVPEEDIEEMFSFADSDGDGRLSYEVQDQEPDQSRSSLPTRSSWS